MRGNGLSDLETCKFLVLQEPEQGAAEEERSEPVPQQGERGPVPEGEGGSVLEGEGGGGQEEGEGQGQGQEP